MFGGGSDLGPGTRERGMNFSLGFAIGSFIAFFLAALFIAREALLNE